MNDLSAAVADLFDVLARHNRHLTVGDGDQSRQTDMEVGGHVAHIVSLAGRPVRTRLTGPPPRPVAIAMAQALFSAPHLSRTLSVYTTASDTEVFQATETLAEALGLPMWQLEEIRAEVDLQVAGVLKQSRALHWLWQRAGNPRVQPEPLFQMLFPGVAEPQAHHFAYRGCRLYAVMDQDVPPPPESLYLQWLPGSERWTCIPNSHFAAKYLDPSVRRGAARAIGSDDDEITTLLDACICTVPTEDEQSFIRRDRWRNEGWAALTGLGRAEQGSAWLTLPLARDAIGPEGWLDATDKGLTLANTRRLFDRHAMARLHTMMHGLYSEIVARLLAGLTIEPGNQAWLFDLDPYIQRVLQPLLDWAAAPHAHAWLADELGVSNAHVGAAMAQVRDGWLKAARTSWGGKPSEQRPFTVQSILAVHLALCQSSLHRLYRQEPDDRASHHRMLLLFFAHYHRNAPLGRLWRTEAGGLPAPEDAVGEWFWGTWMRVLDATDAYT